MGEVITVSDSDDSSDDVQITSAKPMTIVFDEDSEEGEQEEGEEENQSDIEILESTFEPVYTSKEWKGFTTTKDGEDRLIGAVVVDQPRPSISKEFDIRNALPRRNPLTNSSSEKVERTLAPGGGDFTWSLEALVRDSVKVKDLKGKGKAKTQNDHSWHASSFFSYSHLPGLGYMKDVAAIVGGSQVEIIRISDNSEPDINLIYSDKEDGSRIQVDHLARIHSPLDDVGSPEDFYTCSWSVNVFAWPYIPILAVGGGGKVIEIYQIFSHPHDHDVMDVLHERSITGHGAAIYNLKFSLSHPHLLSSASDDGTIRLWSSQIPTGSNSAMKVQIEESIRIANNKLESGKGIKPPKGSTKWKLGNKSVERHLVKGEMLAMLADEGHRGGALSCDIHPILPLLVSSGRDGTIKVSTFPSELRGPSWPKLTTTAVYTPTPKSIVTPHIIQTLFTSAAIHQGQWVDQVSWNSSTDCSIISKSNSTYTPDTIIPPTIVQPSTPKPKLQKSIKFWSPNVLTSLLSSDDPNSAQKWYDLRKEAKARREADGIRDGLQFDESAGAHYFDYKSGVELRIAGDENYVGDTVGILRKSMFTRKGEEEKEERVDETMLFVPHFENSTVEVFRPHSLSSIIDFKLKLAERPEIVEALFPLDGVRQRDFIPEILPSKILELRVEQEREKVHFRSIEIQPEGGKWMLGVGDNGLVAYWRRRKCQN